MCQDVHRMRVVMSLIRHACTIVGCLEVEFRVLYRGASCKCCWSNCTIHVQHGIVYSTQLRLGSVLYFVKDFQPFVSSTTDWVSPFIFDAHEQ